MKPEIAIILFLFLIGIRAYPQATHRKYDRLKNIAESYVNINSDSVIQYADSAYHIAGIKQPDNQLEALFLIINTQIKKGLLFNAISNCMMADSIVKVNNLIEYSQRVLMYTGLVYNNSGLTAEGIEYLHKAKEVDATNNNSGLGAELDYYLAIAFFNSGEIKKSRDLAFISMKSEMIKRDSVKAIENALLLASTFNNPDSVGKYLSLVESLLPESGNNYKRVVYLNNRALFYKTVGKIPESKIFYLKAFEISKSDNYQKQLALLLNNYAYVLMYEGKSDSVKLVLTDALNISRRLNSTGLEASILDSYSDYYASIGDTAQSFIYYKKSVKLKNENRKKQQVEKSLFLATVFETEKKEKQIVVQKNEISRSRVVILGVLLLLAISMTVLVYFSEKSKVRKAMIKTLEGVKKLEVANALIQGQDDERKRLAMDLHDGIAPKIGVLKMSIETSFDQNDATKKTISNLDEIARDIREVSHRMLPSQLEGKGLVIALENFINLAAQSNKNKIVFYHNLSDRLNARLEKNLFFLAYELINNAIKHSNADKINIQLLKQNKMICLSVEDNGMGFDTTLGMEGLGLKNIRQRVNFLEGDLLIDSELNRGTEIIIEVGL